MLKIILLILRIYNAAGCLELIYKKILDRRDGDMVLFEIDGVCLFA